MSRWLLLIVVLVAPLYMWRLDQPGFSDTEGMFAEPAREMMVSGDWVTPTMNGEPFLVKPPMMYWLPALVFQTVGLTEWARVVPAAAALATVATTGALGTLLGGVSTGAAAALVLATTLGFLLEARMLRADMVLVLSVTFALWCYTRLRCGQGRASAIGLWSAIGIGLLDKGLLALLLPGAIIAVLEWWEGALRPRTVWSRLGALDVPLGIGLLALVAVPWHLFAGARNPGFLWDYVVNQHLLFFFDEKLPRDSIPDTLGFFWGMFVARGLPWSLLLPAAILSGWRMRGHGPSKLPLVWLGVVLMLFSLAAGRLEHYALPALPALALLVGRWLANLGRAGSVRWWAIVPLALGGGMTLGAGLMSATALIARLDPSLARFDLAPLARPALSALAVGLLAMALFTWRCRGDEALGAGAIAAVVFFVCGQIAHERVESLFSWRPFASTIRASADAGAPIFFRASDEYQLCGGLDYYSERFVRLLAPAGWVPPTFLAQRAERLFTPRSTFERAWQVGVGVFVSDDVAPEMDAATLVPGPFVTIARVGERVLLAARPAGGLHD